jgi:hypothetical protein
VALLDATQPSKRASNARLVLELDELAQMGGWIPLDEYASIRRIPSLGAARRSLFRLKKTLADYGVRLELKFEHYNMSARFATKEIGELIEPDLRAARRLVEVLDAKREGREPDLDGLAREAELVNPESLAYEFRDRLKPQEWIARKHGIGVKRLRRILASGGPLTRPPIRCVERHRDEAAVTRALEAANRGERIEEIAKILDCSERTARRFARRHGIPLVGGLRLGTKLPRSKKGKKVAAKSSRVARPRRAQHSSK